MEILFLLIVSGIVGALLGQMKNRPGWGFFISFLFPFFGWIIAVLLPKPEPRPELSKPEPRSELFKPEPGFELSKENTEVLNSQIKWGSLCFGIVILAMLVIIAYNY